MFVETLFMHDITSLVGKTSFDRSVLPDGIVTFSHNNPVIAFVIGGVFRFVERFQVCL